MTKQSWSTSISEVLRQALRQLLHARSFSIPAVLGLALGIAAATAVFSLFHAMLLRPMGFDDTRSLVSIWLTDTARGQKNIEVCYADLVEWRKQSSIFSGVALATSVNLDFPILAGTGEPRQVDATQVSGEFFRVLGAVPAAGRFFTTADDRAGVPLRAVISDRLWRSEFGGDPSVIGRQIRSGGESLTIIGVARPDFDFPRDVDIWVTIHASWPTVEESSRLRVFRSVARLRPGVGIEPARAQMAVVARRIEAALPPGIGKYEVLITPMLDEIFGDAHAAIWILFWAVLLVQLIACVNAANLILARATERSRELAVRSVLGAGRWRLTGHLLAESLLLAIAAGVAGTLLAAFAVSALARLAPAEIPRVDQVRLDLPILAFSAFLTLATALLAGLIPAWMVSRTDASEALKQSGPRSSASRTQVRIRGLLIASEVTLCIVLLVGAGLLLRSFARLAAIDPGFDPRRVLTFRLTLDKPDQESRRAMYSQVLSRLRALPGVESAGAVLIRPLSGIVGWDTVYAVEGQAPEEQMANPNGNYEAVSPGYFRTIGIRLLAGRDFTESDTHLSTGVVIVNESTARRHWPQGSAVGGRLRLGREVTAPWLTVVGVVRDVRYREWEAARPDLYIPYLQRAQHRTDFVIKTAGNPFLLAEAVRREVFAIDKNQPVSNLTTMEDLVDRALSQSRFHGAILAALAFCALLLAAIGIYGVLSYNVAQRSREIGVRLAIGATPVQVAGLVTWDGLRVVLAGAVAGVLLSAALSRLIAKLLFGVTGFDPPAYLGAAFVLSTVAICASLGPALRAAWTDPSRALQSE